MPAKKEENFTPKGAIALFLLLVLTTFLFWYVFKLIINY